MTHREDEKSGIVKIARHECRFLLARWQHLDIPATLDAKNGKSAGFPFSHSRQIQLGLACSSTVPQKHRSILIALVRPIFRHRHFDVMYASDGITRELTAE